MKIQNMVNEIRGQEVMCNFAKKRKNNKNDH